ncbi:hypothetical protein ROTAS13_04044 [Roseomonas sp. TAS13]|nr:hypothetical protein ROTAS13_04044 [Roseomonas sp. TAS13]
MPAIGDNRKQDVVALVRLALPLLDRVDPLGQHLLIRLEGQARGRGQDLPLAGADRRQPGIAAQVGLAHHIRDRAEHGDQVGDVDEVREARHRLVVARGLEFQLGHGIAESAGPSVELVQAALGQGVGLHEALQAEHLAHGVGDGRAGGEDQVPVGLGLRDEAGLGVEVPRPLRAIRADALQARHVGREAEFPELLRLVHHQLVDADLADGQHVVLARGERFQLRLHALLQPLQALAGDAVVPVDLLQQIDVALNLRVDQPLLELCRRRDELEGRMRDDDAVPVARGGAGQEALALFLHEVGLVRDQDLGIRVEQQELAAGLRQAVAGHHHHRLGDEPEPALLHDGGRHAEGLSGTDRVGDVGRAGADDAPDHPLLVLAHRDDAGRTRQLQVPPVEGARDEVVEAVVVDARQPVGALRILPDPVLEGRLDFGELLLGRLGLGRVDLPPLPPVLDPGVVDLRDRGIQGVVQQIAGMPPLRAPLRGRGRVPVKGMDVEGPRGDLDGVPNLHRDAHLLGDEGLHHVGGHPGGAEPGGDVGGLQVLGLHSPQRRDVAQVARIQGRGGLGHGQLGADRAGQVGVRRLPDLDPLRGEGGIEEHRVAQLGQGLLTRAADQFGDAVGIDMADLVQGDGEGVGRRGDDRLHGRVDHPLGKDRPLPGRVGVLVIVLDRGHQPAIGVVEEGREVRPAHRLAHLTRFLIRAGGDARLIDGPELPDEALVRGPEADLGLSPGLVGLLGPQHRPHRVADRDQAADDPGVLGEDALLVRRRLHRDRHRLAVYDLHQLAAEQDVAALLGGRALGGGAHHDAGRLGPRRGRRLTDRDAGRRADRLQRAAECRLRVHPAAGTAGVGRAEGAAGPGVLAQHHSGVFGEVAVHAQRLVAVFRQDHLRHPVPLQAGRLLAGAALLQEQNVHHDLGAGGGLHRALRQAHGADQVGHARDVWNGME